MPKPISAADHAARKKSSILRCLDKDGKPLSPESTSKAVQDKKDQTNINTIVKKSKLPDGNININALAGIAKNPGRFGDFTNAKDFQEVSNRVIRMNDAFMTLDPQVRLKFNNDPAQLVAFLDNAKKDPKTKEEAVNLGLLPKPVHGYKRLDTPAGNFWIHTVDGEEVGREPIKNAVTPSA